MTTAASAQPMEAGAHGHEDHEHAQYPFLAHHFDTPEHQFDSGKFGIWLFLVTEVLFFGGLFCAYAIYRSLHPEVFVYAHYYLDTAWGAVNTCVLIISSLTAAWAVRNAQLGEHRKLIVNICVTIACALIFMGVKYIEYSHKFHENILWGANFDPTHEVWELERYKKKFGERAEGPTSGHATPEPATPGHPAPGQAAPAQAAPGTPAPAAGEAAAAPVTAAAVAGVAEVTRKLEHGEFTERPRNAGRFFSIYFCMTGLHGIHVLVGIGIWIWLLIRALKREFGPKYFGPIDYAALYWHLVDLIWIYLFPLLYLIH